jgi:hypothetical protein
LLLLDNKVELRDNKVELRRETIEDTNIEAIENITQILKSSHTKCITNTDCLFQQYF